MKPNALVFYAMGVLAAAPACVSAQDKYPSKPIQMLVAYSTGTTTDILARTFAKRLPLRVGFEDDIYLPDGEPARHNHELVAAMARIARDFGREPATTDEAREIFGIHRQGRASA